jgi:hypothetical protein
MNLVKKHEINQILENAQEIPYAGKDIKKIKGKRPTVTKILFILIRKKDINFKEANHQIWEYIKKQGTKPYKLIKQSLNTFTKKYCILQYINSKVFNSEKLGFFTKKIAIENILENYLVHYIVKEWKTISKIL